MKWPWQEFADDPIGYCRSFLIVVAMFMVSALIIGLARTGWAIPATLFQVVMTVLVTALAVLALGVAVVSGDASVERVADAFSRHEVSILFLVLAWPFHVVLGPLWKRKRNGEPSHEKMMKGTSIRVGGWFVTAGVLYGLWILAATISDNVHLDGTEIQRAACGFLIVSWWPAIFIERVLGRALPLPVTVLLEGALCWEAGRLIQRLIWRKKDTNANQQPQCTRSARR